MKLTVFEQGDLGVGSRGDERAAILSREQAASLVDLGDRMSARFVTWKGPTSLRVEQFVGFVRVGDLELEVLPKIDAANGETGVRRSLLAMLGATQQLDIKASEAIDFQRSAEPVIAVLARLYCQRLLEAVRRGLRQDYVIREECLPHVRGKIDWSSQATSQVKQRLEFNCVFDERSEDTPLNRTLKAALIVAGRLIQGRGFAALVNELRHAMAEVTDGCPAPEQLARLRTDRTNQNLRPLLSLAKLILGNGNPDLGRSAKGDRGVYAVVWDMNVLFEEYVGHLATKTLGAKGFGVDLQARGSMYLAKDLASSRNTFLLTPDMVVRRGRETWAVVDTKWKLLESRQGSLNVAVGDVYQVLAYAHRLKTTLAVLVYPHRAALGTPGLQREFLVHWDTASAVTVRVVTVDLARLDRAAENLHAGIGVPLRVGAA